MSRQDRRTLAIIIYLELFNYQGHFGNHNKDKIKSLLNYLRDSYGFPKTKYLSSERVEKLKERIVKKNIRSRSFANEFRQYSHRIEKLLVGKYNMHSSPLMMLSVLLHFAQIYLDEFNISNPKRIEAWEHILEEVEGLFPSNFQKYSDEIKKSEKFVRLFLELDRE